MAQKRPRFANGVCYDPQSKEKRKMKWEVANQFRRKGGLIASQGNISIEMTAHMAIPKSWSKKRSMAVLGKYTETKPDIDNIAKLYLDVLNGIVYADDKQVAILNCQKVYSDNPRVDIVINKIGEDMQNEHAITFKNTLSLEDVKYLIKKANRLGKNGREIFSIYTKTDEEGTHVYFDVENMKVKNEV